MTQEKSKIKVKFFFPDDNVVEYSIDEVAAMELEAYINTSVPRRLLRRILRIGDILTGNKELPLDFTIVQSGSRSGDAYNALRYLEYHDIIQKMKDVKLIKVISEEKLKALLIRINSLLKEAA